MQENPPPLMFSRDLSLLGYELADPRVGANGVGVNNTGTFILPDPRKKFYWERFWQPLWEAASQRLKEASTVLIHGYSLPPADEKARELLFDNIKRDTAINVHCRSTSDRIADEFRGRGFADVNSFPAVGFETWAS
jgi:hypothetical protein